MYRGYGVPQPTMSNSKAFRDNFDTIDWGKKKEPSPELDAMAAGLRGEKVEHVHRWKYFPSEAQMVCKECHKTSTIAELSSEGPIVEYEQ